MSQKSKARKEKKAAINATQVAHGIDSRVLIAMWALKRQPSTAFFVQKAKSRVTVRIIGRVGYGKTGEVTFEVDKQQALELLGAPVPLNALEITAQRDLPFVEEPIVMLSVDSDTTTLPHVTVVESAA